MQVQEVHFLPRAPRALYPMRAPPMTCYQHLQTIHAHMPVNKRNNACMPVWTTDRARGIAHFLLSSSVYGHEPCEAPLNPHLRAATPCP